VRDFDFYSVFTTEIEYSVREKTHEIGTLHHPVPPKERFILGGATWSVTELDRANRIIYVEKAEGISSVSWLCGGEMTYYTRVLQKMRDIVQSEEEFAYLNTDAAERLSDIRMIVKQAGALGDGISADIFQISPRVCGVFPWLGSNALNALVFALERKYPGCIDAQYSTWYMLRVNDLSQNELQGVLREIKFNPLTVEDLLLPAQLQTFGKYDDYVPPKLLQKQFVESKIDIVELQRELMADTYF
jgi:ATP-dependent Lhr-like helicase